MSNTVELVFNDVIAKVEECLTDREIFVLYSRNGYPNGIELTLQEIANTLGGITRERVRQIENKCAKKLYNHIGRELIILNLTSCLENDFCKFRKTEFDDYPDFCEPWYITFDELLTEVNSDEMYKALAIFLCVTNNRARIKVSMKLGFIYNSKGIKELDVACEILGLSKKIISQEAVKGFSLTLKANLLENYRLSNGIYLKKGLLKRDIITSILDDYFPQGYHISSKDHYERFKIIYKDLYHLECSITMREIVCAIENDGNYCAVDRGIYRKYEKCARISQELLNDIIAYVLEDGGTIYYLTIYNEFFSQLNNEGIDNWYYFKGVFDIECKGMFFTRRATLSVNSTQQFEDPISDYVLNSSRLITMQELRNKFPGLKDYMFLFRIYKNKDIIALENSRFIYVNNLNISNKDFSYIKNFVSRKINESDLGIVSSRVLYPLLKLENKELCLRLSLVNEQFGLFSLINYLLGSEYSFSRPLIALKGTNELTINKIIIRYLEESNTVRFSFNDIDKIAAKYNTDVIRKVVFIEDISGKYLLVNDNEFVNLNHLKINNIENIKSFIIFTCKKFKKICISNFKSYFLIPKNENICWDKATLFSFIITFCSDELEIKIININYEALDYIIRSKEE